MILIYWLWRLGSICVGHLPLKLCHLIAHLAGSLGYLMLTQRRRNAYANYAQVMGRSLHDPEVKRVTRQAFRNFARYLIEVMRFPFVTQEELDRRVVLHETEEFRRALDEQKGVIFVSAHFGNMELAGVQLARKFARITLAAEVLRAKRLYEWLVDHRAKHNVRLIPYQQAARTLLTALRDNEFVGFFLDLGIRYDHRGVPIKFFGETAYFPAAPALLAHRTGSPIIQGYALVDQDGLIHGHAFPIIHVDKSMDKDDCVRHITEQLAANMEQFIAKYPEQWYIFRRIWPNVQPIVEARDAQQWSVQAS